MYDLTGQTALITGGAQGLGLGIALEFARAGSRVILADRRFDKAQTAAEELRGSGRDATAVALDVTDCESVRTCVQTSIDRFTRIDVLVNNAGFMGERFGKATTAEDFEETFDVNVVGVWRMTQALVPHLKVSGGGKIINIASIAGRTPYAETPAYCASKAAVINLTRSLAIKLGPDNINVNAVCPGPVLTDMTLTYRKDMPNIEERAKALLVSYPLRRQLSPEDIGYAALFLASPHARNITGQSLNVDAGFLMS